MIKLKLIETIDLMQGSHFSFLQDSISIGRSPKSHIVINDDELHPIHLFIFEDEKGFFAKSDSVTFHLNGKRTKGLRQIKVGDQIKIGRNLFSVEQLEKSQIPNLFTPKEVLYKKLITEDSESDHLLEKIESELIEIEERMSREN